MTLPSKVVILGSSGFIGKALYDHLQVGSGWDVLGYTSSHIDLRDSNSLEFLDSVVDEHTVLVMAAALTPNRVKSDTIDNFEANVAMVANLARYLQNRPVCKCVYLSTVAVYGRKTDSLSIEENSPIVLDSYYAAAKLAGESVLWNQADQSGMPLLVLRPCRVFGPGDNHSDYGPSSFIRSILAERTVFLRGNGTEVRDYLFVDDLVRLIFELIRSDKRGVFNVATGQSNSPQEVIEHLRYVIPYDFTVCELDGSERGLNQGFDITKLNESLPDFKFIDLKDRLQKTYAATS